MLFETRDVLEHISCASICLRALRYVILIEVTHCLLSKLPAVTPKCDGRRSSIVYGRECTAIKKKSVSSSRR
jgi:hypothetical protein